VVCRVDGVIDDVFGGVHLLSTNDRVLEPAIAATARAIILNNKTAIFFVMICP
jgi:hypothetical protein